MRISLFIIFVFFSTFSFSQRVIEGYVYGEEGKLPMVNVFDEVSNKWTYTNDKGYFKIIVKDKFKIVFSIMGKEDFFIEDIPIRDFSKMKIYLKDKNLRLDEVVVTASPKRKDLGSAVVLDKYAISQFHSFSLGDVLLQLPNKAIEMPELNTPNILNLRTAIDSKNNAFGVAYIIDGMPISNDENMQLYGYGSDGRSIKTTRFSTLNSGLDLRSIPVSNIEKIEVIAGVPNAKYGNATTGVVIVKQKAGIYPLQITAKMLGGGNSISFSKGFKLANDKGNLSFSLDYLNANADPRNNLSAYDRITSSTIWSFFNKKGIHNTLSLMMRSNVDGEKEDKELKEGYRDSKNKKDYGFTLNNRTSYQFKSLLVDEINSSFGISYSESNDYEEKFINNGGEVVPRAMKTALHEGFYTPVSFISKMQTKGKPLHINASLDFSKNLNKEFIKHAISFGADFNYKTNIGEGIVFDSKSANTIGTINNIHNSQQGVRPLNFNKYVIASKLFSCYLQDDFSWKAVQGQSFDANIGIRYDNQNGFSSFSPRVNTAFSFSSKFKIRAGVGLTTKAPSLASMFPGNVYFDVLLKDLRTSKYALNVVQTYFQERPKVTLKPSKVWKYEMGADIYLNIGQLNVTAFLNKTLDGFVNQSIYKKYALPVLEFSTPVGLDEIPTYKVVGYRDIVRSYSSATNSQNYTDKGIEFILRFNKIKRINTQFSLMGGYVYSKSFTKLPYIRKTINELEKEYVYGYYEQSPYKQDRMSIRLTATHHIEPLGLLISFSAEQFIFSTHYASLKNIYPYAYMNNSLEYKKIDLGDVKDDKYAGLVLSEIMTKDVRTPLYHNFHIRMTKEMLNGLSISMYANNFFDYHPRIRVNEQIHYKNTKISFGGSVKYSF